jgi:hypothetical protein
MMFVYDMRASAQRLGAFVLQGAAECRPVDSMTVDMQLHARCPAATEPNLCVILLQHMQWCNG